MGYLFFYADLLIGAANKVRLRKRGLALLAFFAGFLLSISSSYAGTIYQSFDNNTFNQNLFGFVTSGSPVTPVVAVFQQQLTPHCACHVISGKC